MMRPCRYLSALFLAAVAVAAAEPPANLALAATATTSYVSGHETLGGLNSGHGPANSNDKSHGAYGNWPRTGTQWVQYDWPVTVRVTAVEVYWFDDAMGVRLPAAARLATWDGAAWIPVPGATPLGLLANRFNVVTFPELATTRLRIEMDGREKYSTGILQWRVLDSGHSPNFPPAVQAGPDRVLVLPGRTWLTGRAHDDGKPRGTLQLRWAQESGPGRATFAEASQPETTAGFSAPGDYVLRLSADDGEQTAVSRLRVTVRTLPPGPALEDVPLARYRLSSPLWRSRTKALIVGWIPHCVAMLSDPKLPEGGLQNFVEAGRKLAGQPHGDHIGPPWANAYTLNTLEAICTALFVDAQGDQELSDAQTALRATLDDWIPKILAAQEPDGWLHTQYTLRGGPRWRNKGDHQGYVAGYLTEAALAHYQLTGGKDTRLLDAAKRLADCWCEHIGPAPKQAWYDGHEEYELALVRLGECVNAHDGPGRGDKYLALARFLLDCRRHGESYDQSHLPVTQQYEALGHAVRAVYAYTGMTGVARHSADPAYHSAVLSLWDNVVNRKLYVTGGVGSGETSEGFGGDWSLPNGSAYCESCADCGQVMWQQALQRTYQDARYADLAEATLYNALLGSIDLPGRNFTYTNSLDSAGARYAWHGCPCCVGNIPRTLLALPRWIYTKGAGSLYVNQYLGSTVDVGPVAGTAMQVVQETNYPWQGEVKLTLQPAAPCRFALRLRLPTRGASRLYTLTPAADGITALRVNGQPARVLAQQGYAVLDRVWRPGDTVELALPLVVQRVHADPRVAADRGLVALTRGPLVYNAEAVDQPLGGTLRATTPLTAAWREDLLGGVMVLQGEWSDGKPLLAVPNFARLNRGGRSLVWLGEARP